MIVFPGSPVVRTYSTWNLLLEELGFPSSFFFIEQIIYVYYQLYEIPKGDRIGYTAHPAL
jgi:hypothetical protein